MKHRMTLISISAVFFVLSALFIVSCSKSKSDRNQAKQEPRDVGLRNETVEWKRFEDPYLGFCFDYPGDWKVELAEAHRFAAKESDDFFLIAEAGVVAPIADDDREKTNRIVLSETLDEMGINKAEPSLVAAGTATALRAVGEMNDGRLAWIESTTYGDIRYRIRVVCVKEIKQRCESVAVRLMESFKVTDEVRIAGSPFGRDVVAQSVATPLIPTGWRIQENKFGFRFAHPEGWELKQRSRENGYDYESAGIAFSCVVAENYVQDPEVTVLRQSLRRAFESEIPTNGKLSEEPVIRNAGIVKAMVGHGSIIDNEGRFWLAVAVQRDLSYILYLRCASNRDDISKITNEMINSFQVTEELTWSDFMKRLMDRPVPWEKR